MKKAQMAMEFLMTYGWAILVVLVAVGALFYFGVLGSDKFLPVDENESINETEEQESILVDKYFNECTSFTDCTRYHLILYRVN